MEFSNEQPIYSQIADYCRRCISSGQWVPGERIPSTKDLAVALAVNNRTVLKAYDELYDAGVIFQRRGLGYYVSEDAPGRILQWERTRFTEVTLPNMAETARRLGFSTQQIADMLSALM